MFHVVFCLVIFYLFFICLAGEVVNDIVIGAGGVGFDFQVGII